MPLKLSLLGVFLCVLVPAAYAEQPIQSLFIMPLVYTQERGEIQVELNSSFGLERLAKLRTPLAVEYGLTDDVQFAAEWSGPPRQGDHTEMAVGVKRHFGAHDRRYEAAVGIEASKGDEAGTIKPYFVAACNMGGAQLSAHVAALFIRGGKAGSEVATALLVPVSRCRLTTEALWSSSGESRWELAPGIAIPLGKSWEIGGSVLFVSHEGTRPQILSSLRYNF